MNKYVKVFILLVVFNILFFSPLFFPKTKLIITPEFLGGDNTLVLYPNQKYVCDYLHKGQIPFWSKDIAQGYPLLAEGEIGFFNPINLISCSITKDYKLAFNINIVLNNIFGQFGFVLLAEALGLSIISGLYLGLVFTMAPIILMNYMQIMLAYPLLYMGYILTFLMKYINKRSPKNFLLMTLFISLQLIVCHFQMFFISYVFIAIFLATYLYFSKNINKNKIAIFIIFNLAYILSLLLTAFQMVPTYEFIINSNRIASDLYPIASSYDQNLLLKNLVTIISPYISGFPRNATYDFKGIHPWESNFSIYSVPFLFLLFTVFKFKKILRNDFLKAIVLTTFIVTLIAFGKNSPIHFVHSLPIFSSFRYPSRFVMVAVFGLALISAFGFDYFTKKYFKNYLFRIGIFILIIIEAGNFFYSFHVLKLANQVNVNSVFANTLKQDNYPIYSLASNAYLSDQRYVKEGYQNNSDWYYQIINSSLIGNNNSIYGIPSFLNKSGPQLKRKTILYGLVGEVYDEETKTIKLSKYFYNVLKYSGVKYVISVYRLNDSHFRLLSTKKVANIDIYLFELIGNLEKVNFYDNYLVLNSLYDFDQYSQFQNFDRVVLLENYNGKTVINNKKVISKYSILSDADHYLKIMTNTDRDSILYLPRNWYPSWKAYVNGKETQIIKANIDYMAIELPKGDNIVEFKFTSEAFYWGVTTSIITLLALVLYISLIGTRSRSFKR